MNEMIKAKVTGTGLIGVENLTEAEFFEQGERLAQIEHGLQWAIGDWYNNIPKGACNQYAGSEGKAAACLKVGLNPKTAKDCGWITRQFSLSRRRDKLSFDHHRRVAVADLTASDRDRLLKRAIDGGWSAAKLKQERDIILGKAPPPPTKGFDDGVKKLEAEVAKKMPEGTNKATLKKVVSGLNKLASNLKHEFSDAVEKSAEAKAKVQRENLKKAQDAAEEQHKRAIKMAAGVKAFMTKDEFMLVRKCLHPDINPHPDAAKAFAIFNRLADVKNW